MAHAVEGYAGYRTHRTRTDTGAVTTLYRGDEAGFDTFDGQEPWSIVCERHGHILMFRTRKVAEAWLSVPSQWCA